jgi:transposase
VTEGLIEMNQKERDRLTVIQSIAQKRYTITEAATLLKISTRQVKRLLRAHRQHGDKGLVSKHRGRRPNNALADAVRQQALELIRASYSDFSVTLAHEQLTEQHGLHFSVETLRQWMISAGLWRSKSCKPAHIHQSRQRRPRVGELIQIDGSPHDWFEGRSTPCTLIVFIDDATSQLMALHFAPAETTQAYMQTLQDYLSQHGRPVALYSDKHGIFRVNHPNHEGELTQFSRALKTLGIEMINANTPQAKGRVERANQTLQDRLVKAMRLQKIDTMEQANAYLPTFIADYNQRFAVEPQQQDNAHREIMHSDKELELILCRQHRRKLSKNLTCRFQNIEYQLQNYGNGYRLRGATITVCQAFDGSITLLHEGKTLTYRTLQTGEKPIPIVDEKSVHEHVEMALRKQKSQYKPAVDHPWRKSSSVLPPSAPR